MAYTAFGEFMRILRVKHHENMGDLADVLNVKTSFVSAVENGKRNVPAEWVPTIIEHYNLNEEESAALRGAIDNSKTQVKVSLVGQDQLKRQVAFQFARSFDTLSEDKLRILQDFFDDWEDGE